ncbi:helix-turn-helix transcriptional regulator [Stackebrandtia nassauensis]|nr:helix-turn-helix transcriptional regulator [Stackebrandtia nassauensis]
MSTMPRSWQRLLDGVGLTAAAERVYRAILADPRASPATLAEAAAVDAAALPELCELLRGLGLIDTEDDGTARPVDPRIGMSALLRRQQDGIERAVAAVTDLTDDFLDGQTRIGASPLTELVRGRHHLETTIRALITSARSEVAVLDTPPYAAANSIEPAEEFSLESGVSNRAIYAAEVLENPELYDNIRKMTAAGEQARMLPEVPLKLLVVDGSRALLPITLEGDVSNSAVLVHPSALTTALTALFEALWAKALPIFDPVGATHGPLDPEERELLGMLASGVKDEAIARRLGISNRTVSRRVNRLLERLGAANRFQAGLQAARQGWLEG